MSTDQNTSGNAVKPNGQQEAVKKAVRKANTISLLILAVVAIIFYLFYSHDHNKQVGLMQSQKTTMGGQISERDSIINEWIMTFDEIEKNIAMIKEKEKLITINSTDVELAKGKKELILDDIKAINTLLEQNKKKIANLTAQLAKSGGTIKALQTKVAALEASVKQSEEEINNLKETLTTKNFQIEQLNTEVTGMKETIVQKDSVITNKVNELNKAFYVVGTYKDLKAKGLLTKEGGFIGLGKTEKIVDSFSDASFTQIDVTATKSIAVSAKEAKLISEHPAGSYEFARAADNKIISLEIKDPAAFWKISKYAVIELVK